MNSEDENLDILQNLEFCVVEFWRARPDTTDYTVSRAYEAAIQFYRAEARGQVAKQTGLTGPDAELFAAVKAMCEFRLGRGQPLEGMTEPMSAVPVDKLLDCLRKLAKSVERHTKHGGRQGYLTFIAAFLP